MATPNQPPRPLTLAKDHPYGAWQCCTCIEKYYNGIPNPSDEQRPWQTNKGDLVCRNCIEGLFQTAFKFDFEYPARWGGSEGIEMQIDHFAVLWPDGVFPASYKAKGVQLELHLLKVEENLAQDLSHLKLGKDIQLCPQCKAPRELWDGCNHMACPFCSMDYCFLCGKEAYADSGHWAKPERGGLCPRFGRLDDGNAIYDGEEEDQALVFSPEISFETWIWNLTMQLGSEQTQALMQRMLGLPVATERQGPLSDAERRQVLDRMLQYRLEHGVSREDWAGLVAEHRHEAVAFINGGNLVGDGNIVGHPIVHGALARPIGGVFNLASDTARRGAYEWAQERYNAWVPTRAEHPMMFAIFDVGPGSLQDREDAAELMDILTEFGHEATGGQIEFTEIESPLSQYLLAQVTGRGTELDDRFPGTGHSRRENPLSNLMFEFLHPRNARETAQREEIRQEMGWFRDPPQPGHVGNEGADVALERALLADIELNANTRLAEDAIVDALVLRLRTEEQRATEAARVDQRAREMFRVRQGMWGREAEDDETIVSLNFVPARPGEVVPREPGPRRSPFAEQSLEPWAQPWDELTRVLDLRPRVPQNTPEEEFTAEGESGAEL